MEGHPSKGAENPESQNVDTFNHRAPPPGYNQPADVPMQPMYGAPAPVGATIVSTVIVQPALGNDSSRIQCPSCHQQNMTRVDFTSTWKTHVAALLLCVFGCWPCVFVPYCIKSCRSAQHYCTNCGAYIGSATAL